MSCPCGRPANQQGRRCCQACRFRPVSEAWGHTRYCRRRSGEQRRGRRPTDFTKFDPYVIACVASGIRMRVHATDAGEAVRALVLKGKNDREIGEAIGRTPRQVLRIRQRLGLPAVERYRHKEETCSAI